jgi:uncharacterized protein YaaW (UPF0174 family)
MSEDSRQQKEPFNVYCNSLQVSINHYDFTIALNEQSPDEIRKLGQVKMSPEHAKVAANVLMQNIQKYEDLFGEIPSMDQERLERLKQEGKITIEGEKSE